MNPSASSFDYSGKVTKTNLIFKTKSRKTIKENNSDLGDLEYSDKTSDSRTGSAYSGIRQASSAMRPESPISVELKHKKDGKAKLDFGNAQLKLIEI